MSDIFDEYKYAYYYALRTEARRSVVDALNRRIRTEDDRRKWKAIEIASIKEDAIEYARYKWSQHYDGDTHRSIPVTWERLYYAFANKLAHFNVAIWQDLADGRKLRGMAFGKPSRGKTHLTINWLERSPGPEFLEGGVLLPILSCAEQYAKLLGCRRVFIKDPVDKTEFEKYGYVQTDNAPKGGVYLVKELGDGK